MSDLLGANVLIPGKAWQPVQAKATAAQVIHFARPTRGYPEGRVKLLCDDGTEVWWDVTQLPRAWIISMATEPIPTITTPRHTRRRSIANTPTGSTTGPRRGQQAVGGYESTGAGGFSDTDAANIADTQPFLMSSAGPVSTTTAITPRGAEKAPVDVHDTFHPTDNEPLSMGELPRRSRKPPLRFAPGTVSPGKRGATGVGASTPGPVDLQPEITPFRSMGVKGVGTELISPAMSPRSSDGGCGVWRSNPTVSSSAPPRLSGAQVARNTLLMALVTLPALCFYRQLRVGCGGLATERPLADVWQTAGGAPALVTPEFWCAVGHQQPLLAVNLVFFLNVDVLFWLISLLQGSTWLIDPYWTIAPVMIGLFYQFHPVAVSQPLRSRLAMGLLWLWAVRLTHSYFRREECQVGAREDWRYSRMAQRYGRVRWALLSFFAVGLVQHAMLVGITLPLFAIHSSLAAWNPLVDTAIFLAASTGIMIALLADNQLRDFMVANEKRVREGRHRVLLLETGLWRYSRHPNFFGEQLWWWSLGLWAVVCGQPWMLVGAAFNTLCFIPITRMTEARMLERPECAALYSCYQKTTSVWVPWFRRSILS